MAKITGQELVDFKSPAVIALQALLNGLQILVKCSVGTFNFVWETGPALQTRNFVA